MNKSALMISLFVLASTTFAADEYKVLKRIPLGGDGSWDYLTMDSAAHCVYIGRSDRVMVVDVDAEKLVGEVGGMNGVHGAAIVSELNKGFVTSGKDNTVRVFDLTTLKETSQIKATNKPDAIIYDPLSKKVFAFNNGGTTTTVIDPAEGKAVKELDLGGAPEFAVSDLKGKVFVNLEDKSEIAVIDAQKLTVEAHWSLEPGKKPTGLSMDLEHRRLFAGCNASKTLVVVNADSGHVLTSAPIGAGVDATAFDPDSQNAFASNGDGTLTVVHEENPDTFTVIQIVKTQAGSKTMTFDPKTHRIYLGAAEKNGRTVTPGTFALIVVGK
ncbi:MAG TPA: YncE family protein [Planctomycetota bacterium]|nr:YncE family protein [Planctomycetota bacterium]